MEAKKYLASILTASLLLGFQVKAEDAKEEDTLKNIETIVATEAKNENVSVSDWYKDNQNVILGVAGAAVVGGGIVGAYFGGKHVGEKKDERAYQSSIIAEKKLVALPKAELEAKIKKCSDANTTLDKEIKDLNEAISKLNKDTEAKVLAAKNEELTKKNQQKDKNTALVAKYNEVIAAQANETTKEAYLKDSFDKLANKEIVEKEAELKAAFAKIAADALKKPAAVATKEAPAVAKTTADATTKEAPKADAKK